MYQLLYIHILTQIDIIIFLKHQYRYIYKINDICIANICIVFLCFPQFYSLFAFQNMRFSYLKATVRDASITGEDHGEGVAPLDWLWPGVRERSTEWAIRSYGSTWSIFNDCNGVILAVIARFNKEAGEGQLQILKYQWHIC